MDELQKCAEILVERGYAETFVKTALQVNVYVLSPSLAETQPFANTFEGMKQANAIEDYFEQSPELWDLWNSFERPYMYNVGESMHDWRLDRIRWCIQELIK